MESDILWQEVASLAVLFLFVLIVGVSRQWSAMRARRDVQETIRAAIQAGQTLTPETIEAIAMDTHPARGDLRAGVVLLASAAALLVIAALIPLPQDGDTGLKALIAAGAALPGFIGAARLLLYWLRLKSKSAI